MLVCGHVFWALGDQGENFLQLGKMFVIEKLLETYYGLLSNPEFTFLGQKEQNHCDMATLTLQFQVNGTTRAQAQEHLQMDVVANLFRCHCMLV